MQQATCSGSPKVWHISVSGASHSSGQVLTAIRSSRLGTPCCVGVFAARQTQAHNCPSGHAWSSTYLLFSVSFSCLALAESRGNINPRQRQRSEKTGSSLSQLQVSPPTLCSSPLCCPSPPQQLRWHLRLCGCLAVPPLHLGAQVKVTASCQPWTCCICT